jgi:serralysin
MKSKFIMDLQDPSDGLFNTAGAEVHTNFFPAAGFGSKDPFGGGAVPIPFLALTGEAQAALSAQSGPTTVTTMTSGGITINLLFDAAAMAAPQSFRDAIQQAAAVLTAAISDKITVNIRIDYSGTGGGAAGGPDNGLYEPYSTVRADLVNNATPGDTIFSTTLPTGTSFQGQTSVAVWNAQLKLWGVQGGPTANDTTTDDGSATFATDINQNLLIGVALHELTHAMGRVPYGPTSAPPPTPQPDIFDFFRFTGVGTRLIKGGATAPAAYFSVDGGNTKLADYGQTSDASDFLNSGVQGSNDPFNEFYGGGTLQGLTAVDLQQLDALGFHPMTPFIMAIEAFGSTKLAQIGTYYFLDSISTGTGPELKFTGSPVVTGQFTAAGGGTWTLIGAEKTASGYEVAWKVAGVDMYTVWNLDSNGNYITNSVPPTSGTSAAIENIETSFHQDLNGDGVIGIIGIPPTTNTVIEALGSTSLVEVGNTFSLNSISSGTGPQLKYDGAAWAAGQWGAWAPIGAEATSTGYEVAFKIGANQYTVWNTDSNGNITTNSIGTVSGSSTALESLEASFHQDLNGDGVIGIPATTSTVVIEALGSTSLVEVGNTFSLNSISSGTGPQLKYDGAAWVAGEWGGWAPIGAEATSTGYEVAFKIGANQYTVWNTDSNGNIATNSIGTVSGSSTALESLETSFHQDLNGDGVIGVPAPTAPLAPASSAATATVVSKDNFVFAQDVGAGGAPTGKIADAMGRGGFFSAADIQPPSPLHDAQSGQSQALFQFAKDGHDIVINPDDHGSAIMSNWHWTDPHASGFIIS